MQTKNITTINTLTLPEVENKVAHFETELKDEVKVSARHDGQKEKLITCTEFKIKIFNSIENKCQSVIDFAKQKGLIWSHLINARESEAKSLKDCEQIQFELNDQERTLLDLQRKQDTLSSGSSNIVLKWFFIPVCLIAALGDGILSLTSFHYCYSLLISTVLAIIIALFVSVSHVGYSGWIKQSKTASQKWIKFFLVLLIGFMIFFLISTIRVHAINADIDLSINNDAASSAPAAPLLPMCITSFVMFAGIVVFSLKVWRSPEQQVADSAYQKLGMQIKKLKAEMQLLTTKKDALQQAIAKQKSDIRQLYNYLKTTFRRVRSIGKSCCQEYKKVYAQFRNDIPEFFANNEEFTLDEELNLNEPQNQKS